MEQRVEPYPLLYRALLRVHAGALVIALSCQDYSPDRRIAAPRIHVFAARAFVQEELIGRVENQDIGAAVNQFFCPHLAASSGARPPGCARQR